MPPWIIKAAIQGVLSRLPDPQRYNRLLQEYVTGSLELKDEYFLYKWSQCDKLVDSYFRHRPDAAADFVALELGTGWFPITPIGLALSGARKVYSIDMQDLLAHQQVLDTLTYYRKMLRAGRIELRRPDAAKLLNDVIGRAASLSTRELLAELGVEAVIADARDSGLPAGSIDLICSNNTLEHIPRDVIVDIFKEFRRIASKAGLMNHFIDMADHYANFDKSISVYNYLQYSDHVWPLFNNDLQYQNRLRLSDFRAMHGEAGYRVIEEDNAAEPEQLDAIALAPQFRSYSRDDLAVYTTTMISEVLAS